MNAATEEAAEAPRGIAGELSGLGVSPRFDDRIDLDPELTNRESLRLIWRALKLLRSVKALFFGKLCLATLALVPGLTLSWVGKVLIDQVLLGAPIDDSEVRFPPHFQPFVDAVRDLDRGDVLLAVIALLATMLVLFGRGGLGVWIGYGADTATNSELKLNAGSSRVAGVVGVLDTWLHIRLSQRLANGLRTRLFRRLAHLPMAKLDDHRIGDSVYRVMYDAPDVPEISLGLTLEPVFTLIGVAISLYLIQYSYGAVSPQIVWVAGLLVPVGLLATLPASGLIRRVQQASRAAGTATTNAIEENMSNIAAVQSLGGMARERARLAAKSEESYRRFRHVRIMEIGVSAVSYLLTVGLGAFVAIVVLAEIIVGRMTPGDWAALFGLALSIGGAGLAIGMAWINLQANTAAIRRVFFFLDLDAEDTLGTLDDLPPVRQSVRFERVEMRYPNGHRALAGVDLELRIGELVAVVGPTGAGKTSLAGLVPGFYRPSRGRVLIDGHDIAAVDLESLRRQVSYVFQEHLLMSESIRANLRLGNPAATEEDLRTACRTARILDFVESLADGFDTVLGQSGDTLSVGAEAALVHRSRAGARHADTHSRRTHLGARPAYRKRARAFAAGRREGRLVIVIAHRLSTIRRADRIVFMEDGSVREVGTHEALMAAGGGYRRFVELQGGLQGGRGQPRA